MYASLVPWKLCGCKVIGVPRPYSRRLACDPAKPCTLYRASVATSEASPFRTAFTHTFCSPGIDDGPAARPVPAASSLAGP